VAVEDVRKIRDALGKHLVDLDVTFDLPLPGG
jgi:hypothetical protein